MDEYVILKLEICEINWNLVPMVDLIICKKTEADTITDFIKSHPDNALFICYYRQNDPLEFRYQDIIITQSQPITDLNTARFCASSRSVILIAIADEFQYRSGYPSSLSSSDQYYEDFLFGVLERAQNIRKGNLKLSTLCFIDPPT